MFNKTYAPVVVLEKQTKNGKNIGKVFRQWGVSNNIYSAKETAIHLAEGVELDIAGCLADNDKEAKKLIRKAYRFAAYIEITNLSNGIRKYESVDGEVVI